MSDSYLRAVDETLRTLRTLVSHTLRIVGDALQRIRAGVIHIAACGTGKSYDETNMFKS